MGDNMIQDVFSSNAPQMKGKPVKKRLQTERRKMQNRESQRKYRESIKAKLEAFENQAEISRNQEPDLTSSRAMLGNMPLSMNQNFIDHASLSGSNFTGSSSEFAFNFDNNPLNFDADLVNVDFSLPDFSASSNLDFMNEDIMLGELPLEFPFRAVPESSTQSSGFFHAGISGDSDISYQVFSSRQDSFTSTTLFRGDVERNQSAALQEGSTAALKLDNRRTPTPKKQPGIDPHHSATDLIQLLRLNNNSENVSVLKTAIGRGYNVRDVFLAGLSALDDRDTMFRIPLPDPKNNTLTLLRTSTLQAYLTVATSLQIPIDKLYLSTCPSPFYQPGAVNSHERSQAIISSYTAKLPHDLLPTPLQLTVPHHPWLDLIPFPIFRERVLSLMSMTPPMIDMLELKRDIFMSDGIFCWRSSEKGGTGKPWEARNWEAEDWFLKKWWMLVGGESGNLWKQTEWWRRMRGEGNVKMVWDAQ